MRSLSTSLALALLLAHVPAAHAQGIEPQYKAALKLENAGDVVGALAAFEAIPAEKRDFNTRLHIAGCKKKLGRLLEAERDYEAIRTDPKADPATVDTAASDLEDLRPRIPKLVVKLSAATSGVDVTIDGHDAKPPTTVTVNPGAHSVVATRDGKQVFKRDVTLAESTTIEVEVDAPAPASAPIVAAPPAPVTKDVAPASSSSQRTWAYAALGAGAAFGLAAGGAWLLSGSAADDYAQSCGPRSCDESKADAVRRWETLSFVGAGIAIVGVGVGVTLLMTSPKEPSVTMKASTNGVWLEARF